MSDGYSTKDVMKLARLPEHRVRAYVRAGLIGDDVPEARELARASTEETAKVGARGGVGALRRCRIRFSFGDLLVLRTAAGLLAQGVSPRRVEKALGTLKEQLGTNKPLSGVRLSVHNGRVVAGDGTILWEPESGQCVLPLRAEVESEPMGVVLEPQGTLPGLFPENAGTPSPQSMTAASSSQAVWPPPGQWSDAKSARGSIVDVWQRDAAAGDHTDDTWFDLGLQLEDEDPDQAADAYLRALALNPEHIEATINLGRLCAAAGHIQRAAAYFRQASRIDPAHVVAHFNLAVTLQDLDDQDGALAAYGTVLQHDPSFVDAHYNAAMLLQQRGDESGAAMHLRAAEALMQGGGGSDERPCSDDGDGLPPVA